MKWKRNDGMTEERVKGILENRDDVMSHPNHFKPLSNYLKKSI